MPLRKCNGIQNTVTGFWLVAYDPVSGKIEWGFPSKALCFTEAEQAQILSVLTGPVGVPAVGGRPNDRP